MSFKIIYIYKCVSFKIYSIQWDTPCQTSIFDLLLPPWGKRWFQLGPETMADMALFIWMIPCQPLMGPWSSAGAEVEALKSPLVIHHGPKR